MREEASSAIAAAAGRAIAKRRKIRAGRGAGMFSRSQPALPVVPEHRFAHQFAGVCQSELLLDPGVVGPDGFHADPEPLCDLFRTAPLAAQTKHVHLAIA